MKSKTALITGVAGQDGSYLAEFLLSKGYMVVGVDHRKENFNKYDFLKNIVQIVGDISKREFVEGLVKKYLPDEIYNFAGITNVFKPHESLIETVTLNASTPVYFLEAIRLFSPSTKFFQASSAEMFDKKIGGAKNEESAFKPESPYGIAKLFVHNMVEVYRTQKVFAVSGIFFNHESPRRGEHFLTRKVTIAFSKIKLGMQGCLEIGNISALRDWGYAKEYVEGMWRALQNDIPSDYVFATGKLHSVKEFIEASAKALDMKITWEGEGENEIGKDETGKVIVKINKEFYRIEKESSYGDISKIKRELGWEPKTSFEELVELMTKADYNNLRNKPMNKMTVTNTFKDKYSHKKTEYVKCPLCNAHSDYELVKVGYPDVPARNVICKGCGLIRIDPRMSQADYDEFYEKDFFEYLNPFTRPHYVNTIEKTTDPNFVTETEKHTIPFILPFVKEKGKVLDIGAGFGQVLYLLRKLKGVEIAGIEPDPGSRGLAKDKIGIELSSERIEDFLPREKAEGKKYDYIHLEQVFEHLLSPLETLQGIHDILEKEGVLYIGVPGMYNYAVTPDRFFELAHTYGYTPAVLKKFAEQANMKIIKVKNPLSSNLEVLMARSDSSYKEAPHDVTKQGTNWKVTRNRILGRRYYYLTRSKIKNILVSLFGEKFKNTIKNLIRV